jgi:hypothetical protein
MKSVSQTEKEAFEIWKDLSPSSAFSAGLSHYAGHLMIPDAARLRKLDARIDEAIGRSESQVERKFLRSIKTYNFMGEAQIVPDMALDAFFTHMIKEGVRSTHMISLAQDTVNALKAYSVTVSKNPCPKGIRILTSIRCHGLKEIIRSVRKASLSRALQAALRELDVAVNEYSNSFGIGGFKNSGFEEIVEICGRDGCELGRGENLANTLTSLFDYKESPSELESKGIAMLARELPTFRRLTSSLAQKLDVEARGEVVASELSRKRGLKPINVLPFIRAIRRATVKLVDRFIVHVNPHYKTKVIETPSYLSGIVPSGAAYFLDFLTSKPFQLFLATVDPRRAPISVPGELLNLLVHEEYGHCVHSSNSAYHYAAKPSLVELLPSMAGSAISEGISFQRELDFLKYLKDLQSRTPTPSERPFLAFASKIGGLGKLVEEYEFYTQMWRIVRFIRVIGDARINSGKQKLLEFIDWAHVETDLSKSLIYHQVFPAHQGNGPGYASTYAIIGEIVGEMQQLAEGKGVDLVAFNTYVSSMGFPSRSVFEERLKEYVTSG